MARKVMDRRTEARIVGGINQNEGIDMFINFSKYDGITINAHTNLDAHGASPAKSFPAFAKNVIAGRRDCIELVSAMIAIDLIAADLSIIGDMGLGDDGGEFLTLLFVIKSKIAASNRN